MSSISASLDTSFVAQILQLSRTKQIDAAIDEVIEQFDARLNRQIGTVARHFCGEPRSPSVNLDPAVSLAVLSMTLVAKNKLPSRQRFFSELRRLLIVNRGEQESSHLLQGLA